MNGFRAVRRLGRGLLVAWLVAGPASDADDGPGLPPPVAAPAAFDELERHACDCPTCRRRPVDPQQGGSQLCPRAERILQEAFYGRRKARRIIREDLHHAFGGNQRIEAVRDATPDRRDWPKPALANRM